jgi:hypothetical protein
LDTFGASSKLVHSSALGKKSEYNCQKLSSISNAYRRRHANLRSQSVCKSNTNYISLQHKSLIDALILAEERKED